jgi:hypothetical protein
MGYFNTIPITVKRNWEKPQKPHSGQPVSEPELEPGTSQTRSRRTNHLRTKLLIRQYRKVQPGLTGSLLWVSLRGDRISGQFRLSLCCFPT